MQPVRFLVLSFFLVTSLFARDWYRISGSNADVEYPAGLEVIADSLLGIADSALPALAENAGLPADEFNGRKVLIVLTDAPDVTNGYAMGDNVVIFALSSAYVPFWTGTQRWYEQVLTHELAHVVTFRALERKLSFLGGLTSLSTPRWFYEGIAQYYSEYWNTYRGDIYVKNAVLDGNLNMESLNSLEDGRLLYAAGHAFVRYLAETYGDSSLIKLMNYEHDGWMYDFGSAFKEVYSEPLDKVFKKFQRHMILYYGATWANYPVRKGLREFPDYGFVLADVVPVPGQDSTYVVSARMHANHLYYTASLVRLKGDKAETIHTICDDFSTAIAIDATGKQIAYGRVRVGSVDNQDLISFDWLLRDLDGGNVRVVAKDVRARNGIFSRDGNLLLAEVQADGSSIYRIDIMSGERVPILKTTMPLGEFRELPDGSLVISAQRSNGYRDLFRLANGALQPLTDDANDDHNPIPLADGRILFNRFVDENPAIALLYTVNGKITTILNDQYAYWPQAFDAESGELLLNRWENGRKNQTVFVPLDSLQQEQNAPVVRPSLPVYNGWTKRNPMNDIKRMSFSRAKSPERDRLTLPQLEMDHLASFAFPVYDEQEGYGLTAFTVWADILMRQMFTATVVVFPENFDQSLILAAHQIKLWNTIFASAAYHGPILFSYGPQSEKRQEVVRDLISVNAIRSYFPFGGTRLQFAPSIGLDWNHYKFIDPQPGIEPWASYLSAHTRFSLYYVTPTRLYPFVPKKSFELSAGFYRALDKTYDMLVQEYSAAAGTNLMLEPLGLRWRGAYIRQSGNAPYLQVVGIDQLYQVDVQRDYTFTRTVRGISQNVYGSRMYWSSAELNWVLGGNTGLKLLFLPLNNLALSVFNDYARIEGFGKVEMMGNGIELSFGDPELRLGGGYVESGFKGSPKKDVYYLRASVSLGGMSVAAQNRQ
jgi:hypothetical protein